MRLKRNLAQTLPKGQAILAIVKDGGAYESVTVFVPYDPARESASKYSGHIGDVDIIYSWRSTYLMLKRKRSGFHTGKTLKSEKFIVMSEKTAYEIAKALYDNRAKHFLEDHRRLKRFPRPVVKVDEITRPK
jgi:hypothetical protein